MGKIILTTTTAYLLITAAVYLASLPPIEAQSSASIMAAASSPEPGCITYLGNMSDCVNFVVNGSDMRKPDPACCPELAGLINSHPICLCEMISNSTQFELSIDINRALKLPSLCNIKISPDSLCAGLDNACPTILLPSKLHFLIGAALVLFTFIL